MSKNIRKPRFTLKSAQYRIARKEIILDVVIDGEVVEGYPVAWVELRGSDDPTYLKNITPLLVDYKDQVEEAQKELKGEKSKGKMKDLTDKITQLLTELMNASVVEALCDWDEDFFGEPFSKEAAHNIFTNASYNEIYNQIASYMKDRESFLPTASV